MSDSNSKSVKCCVVGDGAVGKTCLLYCYTKNEFPEQYVPTVFDNHSTMVMCDGNVVNLQLWDTAGQEDYDRLRPLSYPGTHVFLLCFSVISPNSYANVKERWIPELEQNCPNVPIVLVGTKTDLRGDHDITQTLAKQGHSEKTAEDGERLAKEMKCLAYVECSARTMDNVNDVFDKAIRAGMNPENKQEGQNCCTIL